MVLTMPIRDTQTVVHSKPAQVIPFPTRKTKVWRYLRANDASWFADYRGQTCYVKVWSIGNVKRETLEQLLEGLGILRVYFCQTKVSRYPGIRFELPRYE
jgi:hypothetical protein